MPQWGGVAADFQIVEPIKGNPLLLHQGVQSGYGSGDCGVPLLVGVTYVFFAGAQGEIDICSGTRSHVQGHEEHDSFLRGLKSLAPRTKAP